MIEIHHPHELLQCFHVGGDGELVASFNLQRHQLDTVWGDLVAEKLNSGGTEGAFVEMPNEAFVF